MTRLYDGDVSSRNRQAPAMPLPLHLRQRRQLSLPRLIPWSLWQAVQLVMWSWMVLPYDVRTTLLAAGVLTRRKRRL